MTRSRNTTAAQSKEPDTPQRSQLSQEVEPRIGRIPFKGRYHRLPRQFEDDYKVTKRVLGKGYNGVVRVASNIHSTSNMHYAVKSFKTKGLADRKRKQLDAEIEIFLCMDHPHIARLVDVYEAEQSITIVMECAEGGELFDRVTQRRFSEAEAAGATRQILLALSYIHCHGIVHRDMKLENILYDSKGSQHLKLIDFGFSKFLDSRDRLHTSCGTLAYIAPEVLQKSYTSQCDLWSLGVVTFILLSGHMPFHGGGDSMQDDIRGGYYVMKHEHWKGISSIAQDFTRGLLTVDPGKRFNAKQALEHKWISNSRIAAQPKMDPSIINALLLWRTAPKFHRACMLLMAWMLTNEQQAQVRNYFLALDKNHDGAIHFEELRDVMVNQFKIAEEEVQQVFSLLDTTHHQEVHYSEFLAAMMASRIELTDDLLKTTFHHFDIQNRGQITSEDFRSLLGDTFEGEPIEILLADIETAERKLNYEEFSKFAHACAPKKASDGLTDTPSSGRRTFAPKLWATMTGPASSKAKVRSEDSYPTLLTASEGVLVRHPNPTKHFTHFAMNIEARNPPNADEVLGFSTPLGNDFEAIGRSELSGRMDPKLEPSTSMMKSVFKGKEPNQSAATPPRLQDPVVLPNGRSNSCCSIQ